MSSVSEEVQECSTLSWDIITQSCLFRGQTGEERINAETDQWYQCCWVQFFLMKPCYYPPPVKRWLYIWTVLKIPLALSYLPCCTSTDIPTTKSLNNTNNSSDNKVSDVTQQLHLIFGNSSLIAACFSFPVLHWSVYICVCVCWNQLFGWVSTSREGVCMWAERQTVVEEALEPWLQWNTPKILNYKCKSCI